MNNYGQDHKRSRNAVNFEAHGRSRGSSGVRRGRGWLFMRADPDFLDSHYRMTSWMAALGGHVRQEKECERLSRGK